MHLFPLQLPLLDCFNSCGFTVWSDTSGANLSACLPFSPKSLVHSPFQVNFKMSLACHSPSKFLSELKRRLPALEGIRHSWHGPAPEDSLQCCPGTVWGQMARRWARTTTRSRPIAMLHTWNSGDRCVNHSQLHTEREDTEDTGRDSALTREQVWNRSFVQLFLADLEESYWLYMSLKSPTFLKIFFFFLTLPMRSQFQYCLCTGQPRYGMGVSIIYRKWSMLAHFQVH